MLDKWHHFTSLESSNTLSTISTYGLGERHRAHSLITHIEGRPRRGKGLLCSLTTATCDKGKVTNEKTRGPGCS